MSWCHVACSAVSGKLIARPDSGGSISFSVSLSNECFLGAGVFIHLRHIHRSILAGIATSGDAKIDQGVQVSSWIPLLYHLSLVMVFRSN